MPAPPFPPPMACEYGEMITLMPVKDAALRGETVGGRGVSECPINGIYCVMDMHIGVMRIPSIPRDIHIFTCYCVLTSASASDANTASICVFKPLRWFICSSFFPPILDFMGTMPCLRRLRGRTTNRKRSSVSLWFCGPAGLASGQQANRPVPG